MTDIVEFDADRVVEEFFERGWTDGLPVVPPTPEAVDAMIATVDLERDDVIGGIPRRNRWVTVEQAAINAVMAGCRPGLLPDRGGRPRRGARSRVQRPCRVHQHRRRGDLRGRQRPAGRRGRHERVPQRARLRQPGERDDRPRRAARRPQRLRCRAPATWTQLDGQPRQVHAVLRRGGPAEPLGFRCGSSSGSRGRTPRSPSWRPRGLGRSPTTCPRCPRTCCGRSSRRSRCPATFSVGQGRPGHRASWAPSTRWPCARRAGRRHQACEFLARESRIRPEELVENGVHARGRQRRTT